MNAAHTDEGFLKVLTKSWAYRLQKRLVGFEISRTRLVEEFIRPAPGDRIFDIGCGPGDILGFMPEQYGHYAGFDMNEDYIEAARERWGEGEKNRFYCEDVEHFEVPEAGTYDLALAIGVLHHLNDESARRLIELAYEALRPGGRLITHDCVYIDEQNKVARWIIGRDRGKAVRRPEGYTAVAHHRFEHVEPTVLHDMFRMPYTILVMECRK